MKKLSEIIISIIIITWTITMFVSNINKTNKVVQEIVNCENCVEVD